MWRKKIKIKQSLLFVLFLFRFWFGIFYGTERVGTLLLSIYFFYLSTVVGMELWSVSRKKYTCLRGLEVHAWKCVDDKNGQKSGRTHIHEATPQPISPRIRFDVGCRECGSHRFPCICDDDVTIFIAAPHVCMANMSRYNL